eukprot:m.97086 g.97086  ORF g.97086 m.97086 type:complete len:337 (-) comp26946_c0_seq7:87-1097(-)
MFNSPRWMTGLVGMMCLCAFFLIGSSHRTRHSIAIRDFIDESRVEVAHIHGVEVLLRTPPPRVQPKGILLVLHGCSHGALDWGSPSECVGCVGLPEERLMSNVAVGHRMVVVAPSSANRVSKCWDVYTDGPRLKSMLDRLLERELLQHLPVFAFGASSGGAMAYFMPEYYQEMKAIAVQVAALPNAFLQQLISPDFPPTLLLHMSRDARTQAFVEENIRELAKLGIKAKAIEQPPAKVTATYLSSKIGYLTEASAAKVVSRLLKANIIDADGMLVSDPRQVPWRDCLAEDPLPELHSDTLVADASALSEVLNVAWAKHELYSDAAVDMMRWFDEST